MSDIHYTSTELPWHGERYDRVGASVRGFKIFHKGATILTVVAGENSDRAEPICKANVELILKAVTHHDALVVALECLLQGAEGVDHAEAVLARVKSWKPRLLGVPAEGVQS